MSLKHYIVNPTTASEHNSLLQQFWSENPVTPDTDDAVTQLIHDLGNADAEQVDTNWAYECQVLAMRLLDLERYTQLEPFLHQVTGHLASFTDNLPSSQGVRVRFQEHFLANILTAIAEQNLNAAIQDPAETEFVFKPDFINPDLLDNFKRLSKHVQPLEYFLSSRTPAEFCSTLLNQRQADNNMLLWNHSYSSRDWEMDNVTAMSELMAHQLGEDAKPLYLDRFYKHYFSRTWSFGGYQNYNRTGLDVANFFENIKETEAKEPLPGLYLSSEYIFNEWGNPRDGYSDTGWHVQQFLQEVASNKRDLTIVITPDENETKINGWIRVVEPEQRKTDVPDQAARDVMQTAAVRYLHNALDTTVIPDNIHVVFAPDLTGKRVDTYIGYKNEITQYGVAARETLTFHNLEHRSRVPESEADPRTGFRRFDAKRFFEMD